MVPTVARDADSGATPTTSQPNTDHTDSQSQQTRDSTPSSHMGYLRHRFRGQNLSEEASKLLSSWRQKTSKSYDSLFGKWVRWCNQRNTNPISGSINEVVNFLADLFQQGYQYRSLNAYRSAISSVHETIDGYEVGRHPLVTRLIKGAFHERPPQPKYTTTWDVATVTAYLESLGENHQMHNINDLSHKLVMLMALTRPSRSADLVGLNVEYMRYSPEGVTFTPTRLAKQSRQTKKIAEFFFPAFSANDRLCPVTTLRAYEERTKDRRRGKEHSQLFVSLIKPYNPVSPSTIARWLKSVLTKAGIDTNIFKAHSVRGASTSAAASAGVTTNDILNAADWSSESVFRKFYYRPEQKSSFGSSVLAKLPTTITDELQNHVDM